MQLRPGDIIKHIKAKHIKWRILEIREDGTLEVEQVWEPKPPAALKQRTITRAYDYFVVERA
jgi:hypothetical protein